MALKKINHCESHLNKISFLHAYHSRNFPIMNDFIFLLTVYGRFDTYLASKLYFNMFLSHFHMDYNWYKTVFVILYGETSRILRHTADIYIYILFHNFSFTKWLRKCFMKISKICNGNFCKKVFLVRNHCTAKVVLFVFNYSKISYLQCGYKIFWQFHFYLQMISEN